MNLILVTCKKYMVQVQHVPAEIRLYLSAKALDVLSTSNYNLD